MIDMTSVSRLFKQQYGASDAEASSVFAGQRDLWEFTIAAGRALEQQLFGELGMGYCGASAMRNSAECRFKGYRKRTMHGLFGKVPVKRAHYVGPQGESSYPLGKRLERLRRDQIESWREEECLLQTNAPPEGAAELSVTDSRTHPLERARRLR